METLLGSLLGFLSCIIAQLIRVWRESRIKTDGKALNQKQLTENKEQLSKINNTLEVDSVPNTEHHQKVRSASQNLAPTESSRLLSSKQKFDTRLMTEPNFANALRAYVRPVITFAFFFLFSVIKLSVLFSYLGEPESSLHHALALVWDKETQALFAGVITFWFGQRSMDISARQLRT